MRGIVMAAIGLWMSGAPAVAQETAAQRQQRMIEEAIKEQAAAQAAQLEEIRSAALPKDYKKRLDRHIAGALRDPDSRKVEFGSTPYGSLVCGRLNAKNAYGGYTGFVPYVAYFKRDGQVGLFLTFDSDRDIMVTRQNGKPGDTIYVHHEMAKACRLL